jgi:protein O-mannosyl-transferase
VDKAKFKKGQKHNKQSIQEKKNPPNRFAWLVLIVLGFILYSNTISHEYALDDAIVITGNQFTQKGLSGISDIFKYDTFTGFWLTSYKDKTPSQIQEEKKLVAGGRYRPLSVVSFAIEYQFFGQNPHISHFINIVLYIITCIVLYNILCKLFRKFEAKKWYLSLPLIISMLFLAHPIHTEAVANIKGRDEIMTLLGSLLALWFTIKYLETDKIKNIAWASVSLFLGLLSKENAITFLALIPLSIYIFYDKETKNKLLKSFLPLLLVAGIFLLIRGSILGMGGEKKIAMEIMNNPFIDPISKDPVSFGTRLATIFVTFWVYIRLLVFPHPLTYDYYPYQIPLSDWTEPTAIIALLLYLGMGVYALYTLIKNKSNIISVGIWWYLIPLSVVSNIFFPVGTFMNERFVFISSIGFCMIFGWLIYHYAPKLSKNKSNAQKNILWLLLPVLVLYSGKTIDRNKAWENDFTLFTTDVKVSYNSAKSTCSAGGKLIEEAQKPEIKNNNALHNEYLNDAIKYLERSIEIHPEYADALNLMGNAWYELEQNTAKSLHYYTKVLKLRPGHNVAIGNATIVVNNAFALLNNNESKATPEEIKQACFELVKVKPNIKGLNHLIGTIYGRYQNQLDSAIIYFEKEVNLGYGSAALYKDMGVAYGMLNDFNNALIYFEKAIELDPNDASTWINAAVTNQKLGNEQKFNEYILKANQLQGK